jgi:4-carboxymuconolactone decarboxylase
MSDRIEGDPDADGHDRQRITTGGNAMSRLSTLDEKNLAPDARAFLEALNSGPRGKIGLIGPFAVWAHSPKIGNAAQAFGGVVRFQTALPERVKEIAICTVGAHYKAKFEFAAHGPMAIAAGVPADAVDAIRRGIEPNFADAADRASYAVARELVFEHRLSDATYSAAKNHFGEAALVDLVTIIGYYCMISLTLNAFDVPLTTRMTDPFPER